MKNIDSLRRLWALAAVTALTACGGGGGGAAAPAPAPAPATGASGSAQGLFFGALTGSRSSAFQMLVLENDEFWGVYGTRPSVALIAAGLIQGQGASSNGNYSSTAANDFATVPPIAATVAATYVPATSLNATITEQGGSVTFAGIAPASTTYNYNAAATLAAIAGNWSTTSLAGLAVPLSIAADGSFTGTDAGCSFSGTYSPRASGKNVFDVVLTYGAAPCALAGETTRGVAIEYLVNATARQLITTTVDASRTHGAVYFGTR